LKVKKLSSQVRQITNGRKKNLKAETDRFHSSDWPKEAVDFAHFVSDSITGD